MIKREVFLVVIFILMFVIIESMTIFFEYDLNITGRFIHDSSVSKLGPYVAYGLRNLSVSYTGDLIEIRRESDNQLSNISFNESGEINISELVSFCSATNCFVRVWYDQSGNNGNIFQDNLSLQPIIVQNGEVLVDDIGKPVIYFNSSLLYSNLTNVSSNNLTAFFVEQADYDTSSFILEIGPSGKTYKYLRYQLRGLNGRLFFGNGTSYTQGGDFPDTLQPAWKIINILDMQEGSFQVYRNRKLVNNYSHSIYGQGIYDKFYVGSYTGYVSEIILYPHLNESDRVNVYNKLNEYYKRGPLSSMVHDSALLPQHWQWHIDLYDWLETVNISSVNTTPANLQWDSTYNGRENLANLWIGMNGGKSDFAGTSTNQIVRAEPKWFLLDDGAGSGIEGNGSVRMFRAGDGSAAAIAAFYYTQNLSLSNGSNGNPYFLDPAVCKRALITIAVDMMKTDLLQDGSSSYWTSVDFMGGAMNGWMWAYETCKDYLNDSEQETFLKRFSYMAWKMKNEGAHDVNGNMDTKAVSALAHTYNLVNDSEVKGWCVDGAKKILFGSVSGTPNTTDYLTGLYRNAGYVDEGDTPDTTYNGASLYYLSEAYIMTKGDNNWSFLEEVVNNMIKFKIYQYFKDPDNFFDGPSGYAGRTGNSYVYDQRDKLWRYLVNAVEFSIGRPLVKNVKFGGYYISNESTMVSNINSALSWFNGRDIGVIYNGTPTNWNEGHWPADGIYYPDNGWYDLLMTLVNDSSPDILFPYEKSVSFNFDFDQEFWAYKSINSSKDFGFFIETLEYPGNYDGWYGGSLQTFWTNETGMIILARHDKTGCDMADPENTRCWVDEVNSTLVLGVDSWATHHIWGRDENNKSFSTAATDARTHPIKYNISSSSPNVLIETFIGNGSSKGQQTGGVIDGWFKTFNYFEAIDNGLLIKHIITSNQSDFIRELWLTLPVVIKNNWRQSSLNDTIIEYWNNTNYTQLGTSLVRTSKLRLGRDFGDGISYVYVHFDGLRKVKLNDIDWNQSYQGDSIIRNIKIDLHGLSGRVIRFPLENEIELGITTDDRILGCLDNDNDHILDYNETTCSFGKDYCPYTNRTYLMNNIGIFNSLKPVHQLYNLSEVNSSDALDNENFSVFDSNIKIKFKRRLRTIRINKTGCFERLNLSKIFNLQQRKAFVNSSYDNDFNLPAEITFYGINYVQPKILIDGVNCSSCNMSSYSKGNQLVVDVPGFSEYEITEGYVDPGTSPPGGGGGGGGGGGVIKIELCESNWSCGDWQDCMTSDIGDTGNIGIRKRVCIDYNNCTNSTNKPIIQVSCQKYSENLVLDNESVKDNNKESIIDIKVSKSGLILMYILTAIIIVVMIIVLIYFVYKIFYAKEFTD